MNELVVKLQGKSGLNLWEKDLFKHLEMKYYFSSILMYFLKING
jgi:hypothetical protein